MKKTDGRWLKKKTLISTILFVIFVTAIVLTAFAHSGRTDSAGGHRDNNNVSGLGYYHYHCGGYPPHLHDNGYCPYTSSGSSSSSTYYSDNSNDYDNGYSDGWNDGYEEGQSAGYKEGEFDSYSEGYDDGNKDGYETGYTEGRDKGVDDGVFYTTITFLIIGGSIFWYSYYKNR